MRLTSHPRPRIEPEPATTPVDTSAAAAAQHDLDPTRRTRLVTLPLIAVGVIVIAIIALAVGRYVVPPVEVARMLAGQLLPIEQTWFAKEATIVFDVRMPRVLLSLIVGSALALAGAVLQGVFRNPLVSPEVLGVSAGASFGGVLIMVLGLGTGWLIGGAFAFGIVALLLVMFIGRIGSSSPLLMIVLGGVVVSAFFGALVSLQTYLADPYTELPSITFWLLGSLASASYAKVLTALIPLLIGGIVIFALRWRLNVLTLGDEDAQALGLKPKAIRSILLIAVALLTAGAVAVSGAIGWVGLLVPHIARLIVGSDNRVLLPASLMIGGGYLTLVDTLSRSLVSTEVPLGILTAVIGAPVFIVLLARMGKKAWIND
ncbi:iron complex transport system permease protein [Leucobacter exalbidus]|uniref:Iron complex transport system permease protein n=1 Tax=Leucobacter exalbidus TaxID=662960 RepID=A0A940PRQ8_9MICO|nr:iron ABC transporter permease [Leucobacter exalbidus]MBP1325558.1 iron complex transport system permease protein [Leucobacter exalbidus]